MAINFEEFGFNESELEMLEMLEKQGVDPEKARYAMTGNRFSGAGSWGEHIRKIKKVVENDK